MCRSRVDPSLSRFATRRQTCIPVRSKRTTNLSSSSFRYAPSINRKLTPDGCAPRACARRRLGKLGKVFKEIRGRMASCHGRFGGSGRDSLHLRRSRPWKARRPATSLQSLTLPLHFLAGKKDCSRHQSSGLETYSIVMLHQSHLTLSLRMELQEGFRGRKLLNRGRRSISDNLD